MINTFFSTYLKISSLGLVLGTTSSEASIFKIKYKNNSLNIGHSIRVKKDIYFCKVIASLPLTTNKYDIGLSFNKSIKRINTKLSLSAYLNRGFYLSTYSSYSLKILNHSFRIYSSLSSNNFLISNINLGVGTKIKEIGFNTNYSLASNRVSFKLRYSRKPIYISISFKESINIKISICVDV